MIGTADGKKFFQFDNVFEVFESVVPDPRSHCGPYKPTELEQQCADDDEDCSKVNI